MPDQLANEIRATLAAARSQFESLTDLGFEEQKVIVPAGSDVQNSEVTIPGSETLDAVFSDLGDCQRCGLGASRTKLVYGVGNPNARLVLVGDAPGREEDLQGEPFVGEAGRLLSVILRAAFQG